MTTLRRWCLLSEKWAAVGGRTEVKGKAYVDWVADDDEERAREKRGKGNVLKFKSLKGSERIHLSDTEHHLFRPQNVSAFPQPPLTLHSCSWIFRNLLRICLLNNSWARIFSSREISHHKNKLIIVIRWITFLAPKYISSQENFFHLRTPHHTQRAQTLFSYPYLDFI